jgi:drug/metabolite transporter (DMT)-like permease
MKSFNAFQMTAFFALAPFALSWVHDASFRGASIAFWVGCVIYFVSFWMMVGAVRLGIDKWDW